MICQRSQITSVPFSRCTRNLNLTRRNCKKALIHRSNNLNSQEADLQHPKHQSKTGYPRLVFCSIRPVHRTINTLTFVSFTITHTSRRNHLNFDCVNMCKFYMSVYLRFSSAVLFPFCFIVCHCPNCYLLHSP